MIYLISLHFSLSYHGRITNLLIIKSDPKTAFTKLITTHLQPHQNRLMMIMYVWIFKIKVKQMSVYDLFSEPYTYTDRMKIRQQNT